MYLFLKYSLALLIGTLYLTSSITEDLLNIICVSLILLFGIPHGAMDHKLHLSFNQRANINRFILIYVMIALGYLLWWLLMPVKAFFLFILISAYHFGQEFVEDNTFQVKEVWVHSVFGILILMGPILINFNELIPFIEVMREEKILPLNESQQWIIITALSIVAVVLMLYLKLVKNIHTKVLVRMSCFICYVLISYTLLPFLLAFTLYFVLFHSSNALLHQFHWLKNSREDYNVSKFIKDLSGFSILSFIGISLVLLFFRDATWYTLMMYFFIMISILTLPHAILFNQLYLFRRKSIGHV